MSSPPFEVRIDKRQLAEVQKALDALEPKAAKAVIQRATTAAAGVLKGPMKKGAPVKRRAAAGARGQGYGTPGDLRDSIRAAKVKKTRGGEVATYVGPMGRKGFTRHWVIQGTKPHGLGKKGLLGRRGGAPHPGSRPNPFVSRAADANEGKVFDKFEKELDKHLQRAWAKRG